MSPLGIGEIRARRAAKLLGVRTDTMYRWCREGRIEARQDITGHYYLQRMIVDEILQDPGAWRDKRRIIE